MCRDAMRRRWASWLIVAVGLLVALHSGTRTDRLLAHGAELAAASEAGSSPASETEPLSGKKPKTGRAAPQKAYDLLVQLAGRQGEPLPGYVGGREFQNRERRLPRGLYREYDVNPKRRGRPRDAERIVIDQKSGKAYYTPDHYRTFIPLE